MPTSSTVLYNRKTKKAVAFKKTSSGFREEVAKPVLEVQATPTKAAIKEPQVSVEHEALNEAAKHALPFGVNAAVTSALPGLAGTLVALAIVPAAAAAGSKSIWEFFSGQAPGGPDKCAGHLADCLQGHGKNKGLDLDVAWSRTVFQEGSGDQRGPRSVVQGFKECLGREENEAAIKSAVDYVLSSNKMTDALTIALDPKSKPAVAEQAFQRAMGQLAENPDMQKIITAQLTSQGIKLSNAEIIALCKESGKQCRSIQELMQSALLPAIRQQMPPSKLQQLAAAAKAHSGSLGVNKTVSSLPAFPCSARSGTYRNVYPEFSLNIGTGPDSTLDPEKLCNAWKRYVVAQGDDAKSITCHAKGLLDLGGKIGIGVAAVVVFAGVAWCSYVAYQRTCKDNPGYSFNPLNH